MSPDNGDEGGIAKFKVRDVFTLDPEAEKHFTGHADLRRLLPDDELRRISVVCFGKGVKTRWHHHHGMQLLWFTEGKGEVSNRAGKTLSCDPNDVVRVDPNVSHRHGAAADHTAEHLAFTEGTTFWEEDDA